MPTNDERRAVAARLRELHLGGGSKDLIELTLSDAIGAWRVSGMSWDFITERLANLIEPEERTCRDVSRGGENFKCSECGTVVEVEYDDSLLYIGGLTDDFDYCPRCGRKVVAE